MVLEQQDLVLLQLMIRKGRAATATATETQAKFVRVAVAVTPRFFIETINCNRGSSVLQLQFVQKMM